MFKSVHLPCQGSLWPDVNIDPGATWGETFAPPFTSSLVENESGSSAAPPQIVT